MVSSPSETEKWRFWGEASASIAISSFMFRISSCAKINETTSADRRWRLDVVVVVEFLPSRLAIARISTISDSQGGICSHENNIRIIVAVSLCVRQAILSRLPQVLLFAPVVLLFYDDVVDLDYRYYVHHIEFS